MKKGKSLFSLLFFGIIACSVMAQTKFETTGEVGTNGTAQFLASLEEVVGDVLSQNPSLRSARLNWEALRERPDIVGALPDPIATYGYFFQSVETRVGAMNQRIGVSQRIPFPGKRSLAAKTARKEALLAMWEYQMLTRRLILAAKEAYFELSRIDQSQRILEEEIQLLEPIVRTAQTRYQTGQVAQQDVLKAQLALNTLQNRLLAFLAQRETQVAQINALRGVPVDQPISPITPPQLPELPARGQAFEAAERYRQELEQAGVAIERDEAALALARRQKWPDFIIGAEYTQINDSVFSSPPDDGQDAVMGFFSVSLPIWFGKWKAQEREAEKRLAATRAMEESLLDTVLAEVRGAWFQAQVQQDQVSLYRTSLLPQAEQTFTASLAGYESGRISFIDLLDSERALQSIRLGLVASETELAKALARLERAIGVDLESLSSTPIEQKTR